MDVADLSIGAMLDRRAKADREQRVAELVQACREHEQTLARRAWVLQAKKARTPIATNGRRKLGAELARVTALRDVLRAAVDGFDVPLLGKGGEPREVNAIVAVNALTEERGRK